MCSLLSVLTPLLQDGPRDYFQDAEQRRGHVRGGERRGGDAQGQDQSLFHLPPAHRLAGPVVNKLGISLLRDYFGPVVAKFGLFWVWLKFPPASPA